MPKTLKEKASAAMSRFVRLRGAVEYCRKHAIDMTQFNRPEDLIGKCCTCETVKSWFRMDGGHFISRGLGGGSGVYFDERNDHLQCKKCNGPGAGELVKYRWFMIARYGKAVVEELEIKDRLPTSMRDIEIIATEVHYKKLYDDLIEQNGL